VRRLRGPGWGRLKAASGGFNLGVAGPVAACPCFGGGRRIFGYVKANYGTGGTMATTVLGGLRLRS